MDLTERLEMGRSFSPSSPARSIAQSLGSEAHSEMVSSAPRESTALVLSSSEEGESASVKRDEAVDLPPVSFVRGAVGGGYQYVAVSKLNIKWPTDRASGASEKQARRTLPAL